MRFVTILAAALALAAPVAAQHDHGQQEQAPSRPQGGMMMPGGGMGMPLMREIHTWRPQHLLERRETLGLSAQQVQRLTELATGAQQAHDRARDEAQNHFRQAGEAWAAGNGDGATSHATAGMQSMQTAHLAMLGAASAARGVLTAEQRARVQGWMDVQGARPMQRMMPREPRSRGRR